jgi:parvulin-like peptidyl-prolyl isomerase
LDELYKAMSAQGVDPEALRQIWRPQIMRELVWSEMVDRPLYFQIKDKEIKAYYDKYPEKFKKEATVTISEIFLAFAGKDEATVREQAKQIIARAKKGEDFAKLVVEFSDRPNKEQNMGKAGTFNIPQLDKLFAEALKDVKAGGIAGPIEIDEGIEILRVDERTAASDESTFNEDSVRQAIWQEKVPEARKKFMKDLKEDAYINIRESYRPIVTPFLNSDLKTENTTASK